MSDTKHAFSTLPEGYRTAFNIDLQKDKKLAGLVTVISCIILVVCLIAGWLVQPMTVYLNMEPLDLLLRVGVMFAGMVAYIILHELVHGIFMKYFSRTKPHYGFTLMYAYAGSEMYFSKIPYIIIALAPIVVWGIVLQALCVLIPTDWFWVIWFIQATNLSGAAGDLYVTWRFSKLPANILVQDTGVSMTVFTKES